VTIIVGDDQLSAGTTDYQIAEGQSLTLEASIVGLPVAFNLSP
jgi:hypothetical protein